MIQDSYYVYKKMMKFNAYFTEIKNIYNLTIRDKQSLMHQQIILKLH